MSDQVLVGSSNADLRDINRSMFANYYVSCIFDQNYHNQIPIDIIVEHFLTTGWPIADILIWSVWEAKRIVLFNINILLIL